MRNKKKKLTLCLTMSLLLQGLLPLGAFADTSNPGTSSPIEGQNVVKTFGGENDEYARDVAFNADESYVILLRTGSADRNLTGVISKPESERDPSLALVKYSANHVMQWIKPTHIPAEFQAASVKATSDGGYIIASTVNNDGYVLKVDGAGDKEWETYIGGSDPDSIRQVIENSARDGYIVIGETKSNDGDFKNMNSFKEYKDYSAFITKLDTNGRIQWTNVLDGQNRDIGMGIVELSDSYMAIGITASTQNDFTNFELHEGNYDLFLAKLDKTTGNLQVPPQDTEQDLPQDTEQDLPQDTEQDLPQDTEQDLPQDTEQDLPQDTEQDVPQDTEQDVPQDTEQDPPQDIEQDVTPPQSFGDWGREDLTAVLPVANGGFVVLGTTDSTGGQLAAGSGNNFLAKFDASGGFLWATRFGVPFTYSAYNIVEVSSNVYAIGATDIDPVDSNNRMKNNIYVIDSSDTSNIQVSVEEAPFSFKLFTHLAGSPEQWIGIGEVVPGYPLPDELLKGEQEVAISHPGNISDEEAVAEAVYDPVMEFEGDDHLQWITNNFRVNTVGVFGTKLTWTSNNPAVVIDSQTGVATVQQPPRSGADVNVTLTVTGERNEVTTSRQIKLTVKKQSSWQVLLTGTAENKLRIRHFFEASNDGTLYIFDGEVLKKKGRGNTTFVNLPYFPIIENENFSQVSGVALDNNDLYVSRVVTMNNNNRHLQILKLGSDNQWTEIETAAIPENLVPLHDERLGNFNDYGFDTTVVDNGVIYQKVSAEYAYGSRDLLMKWNGSEWINVTLGQSVDGISRSFAVQDGRIYILTMEDSNENWALTISDGTNIIVQHELSGNQTPSADYESVIEVGSDGAVYLLNSYSRQNEGYVWKGTFNDNQQLNWLNMDDSFKFNSPRYMAVIDQQILVVDNEYSIGDFIIERSTADEGSSGGGSDNGNSTPPPSSSGNVSSPTGGNTSNETVPVSVNGETKRIPGKITFKEENGRKVTTLTLDSSKLLNEVQAGKTGNVILIPLNAKDSQTSVIELNAALVKALGASDSTLEVKTDHASYLIPAKRILIDQLLQQFGNEVDDHAVKMSIQIGTPTNDQQQLIAASLSKEKAEVIMPSVTFEVTASYNGHTLPVNSYTQFVERRIPVPDGIDPSKITTGVVVDPDGTVRHVPTKVVVVEGKYYAVINSLTNSVYSVVWHPVEFSDVANHWAKDVVNDMGSRMVIDGIGNGTFSPDTDITRAEFAAIIVRGLGLKLGEGTNPFSDVATNTWYAGAVQTASTYGLITGFEDGTFRPNAKITREQAMTIIAKAMKLTGLADKQDKVDSQNILAGFADGSTAGNWAKESIAITIKASIVNGKDQGKLEPAAYVSRAEVAALIHRLLSKSDLI